MTTQQNAPVLDKHRDEAAKAAGYRDWAHANPIALSTTYASIENHAQALANLETANNRLAEIDRIARDVRRDTGPRIADIRSLASGHTPSPCPSCAAKDEAMEAFKADVSEAASTLIKHTEESCTSLWQGVTREALSRFIIPPADPVAEAFRDAFRDSRIGEIGGYHEIERKFHKALKDRGLELSRLPLGGAK